MFVWELGLNTIRIWKHSNRQSIQINMTTKRSSNSCKSMPPNSKCPDANEKLQEAVESSTTKGVKGQQRASLWELGFLFYTLWLVTHVSPEILWEISGSTLNCLPSSYCPVSASTMGYYLRQKPRIKLGLLQCFRCAKVVRVEML